MTQVNKRKTHVFGIDMVKSVARVVVDYGVTMHLYYCEIFDLSVSLVEATI